MSDQGHHRRARDPAGVWLILLAASSWAAIGLLATPLLERGMSAGSIGFWRAAVGGGAFVVHAAVRGVRPGPSWRLLAAFGVIGVGVFYLALPAAIDAGGVSLAWLLLYTAPAWVALAAPRALGEPTDRATAVVVAVTVVGAALVAIGGGEGVRVSPASVGWGLVAGVTYATWYLVSQRAGSSPVATAAVALPVGAVTLLPAASWPGADGGAWGLVVALGLGATYLPVLAYYEGIRRLPAAEAAVLATVEPVAAVLMAWVVLGERLGPLALAGGATVVASAAVVAGRGVRAR